MLLAWKNAHRLEASTFLLMASVCAPLPSVSDKARNSAMMEISSAIFLLAPAACSACSACSMLSCAPMIPSLRKCVRALADARGRRKENVPSGAGMRRLIDLEQPLAVDTGIDLRGGERGVAEQFLDRAQIAAAA